MKYKTYKHAHKFFVPKKKTQIWPVWPFFFTSSGGSWTMIAGQNLHKRIFALYLFGMKVVKYYVQNQKAMDMLTKQHKRCPWSDNIIEIEEVWIDFMFNVCASNLL